MFNFNIKHLDEYIWLFVVCIIIFKKVGHKRWYLILDMIGDVQGRAAPAHPEFAQGLEVLDTLIDHRGTEVGLGHWRKGIGKIPKM